MITGKKFGIIGGDMRQIYAALSLVKDKNEVYLSGFDKISPKEYNLNFGSISDTIQKSRYVILPLPITRDGKTINAPLSEKKIIMNEEFFSMFENKVVLGGIISQTGKTFNKKGKFCLIDYYSHPNFINSNALLTAKGALKLASSFFEKSFENTKCLVVGFGRIGKSLSVLLKKERAEVWVSARNPSDFTKIKELNCTPMNITENDTALDFDIILNTVPALMFNEEKLIKLKKGVLLLDLASNPGGTDKKAAEKLNINFVHALGIPGKMFAKQSGEIIKETVYSVIKEENL